MWKTLDGFLAEKLYENGIIRVLAGAGALGLSVSIKILWRWISKRNFFQKKLLYILPFVTAPAQILIKETVQSYKL